MKKWTKIKDDMIVKDRFIDIESATWKMPNGDIMDRFYHYSKKDGVTIVAKDLEGNFICIRQFRPGVNQITTEMPAGTVNGNEDIKTTAMRELLEETGYTSKKWTYLGHFAKNVFMTGDIEHLFIAENCEKIAEPQKFESEEQEVIILTKNDLYDLIKRNEFEHIEHLVALFRYENGLY